MSTNVQPLKILNIKNPVDGVELRVGIWPEDFDTKKRFLVLLNGRSDWIEKYNFLPHQMNLENDTGFLTFDHRGQGGSGGLRSHVSSYEQYARDIRCIIDQFIKDKPFHLICHSMGALIGLYACSRQMVKPKSVILCSPLLSVPPKPFPSYIARPVTAIISWLGLGFLRSFGLRLGRKKA